MLTSERGLAMATSLYPTQNYGIPCPAHGYDAPPEDIAKFKLLRLAEHWKAVLQAPAYKWLSNRQEFGKAWKIYTGKKAARNASAFRRPEADFQFVFPIAWGLMLFVAQSDPAKRRRLPDKRVATSAIGYARKLLDADLGYLKLETSTQKSLEALISQLAQAQSIRKTSENDSYAQRAFVSALVWFYLKDFGETLFSVVHELCGLVDYQVTEVGLRGQISEIKGHYKELTERKSAKSR